MPWPVYSTRFVNGHTAGAWTFYTVPAGYRAVIKSVLAANTSGVDGYVMLMIASAVCWRANIPVSVPSKDLATGQVAYAGENVGGYSSAEGLRIMISGHLLSDVTLAGDELQDAQLPIPPPGDEGVR